MLDLAVIGAGPCGLAVGVAAKRAALGTTIFDKGPLVASLVKYPLHMTFFSTPEKLEIGEVPFVTAGDKPTRREALTYYRKVAEYFELDVRPYHEVRAIRRHPQGFEVTAQHVHRVEPEVLLARHVVCAAGYLDHPNLLEVPGEELTHVLHFFTEGFPYWQQRVVVVGGGNSAVEGALELCRAGARVTIVHFLAEFDRGVKPWILPDITNRLNEGRIAARWQSRVAEVRPSEVVIRSEATGSLDCIPADFVFALTGYRPDLSLLRAIGVEIDDQGVPWHDPASMETNVPGLYIAGVLAAGFEANRIFIENGRAHGALICAHIKAKPPRVAPGG